MIGADGTVVWGNSALSELLQRNPNDIIGRSAESLLLPLPQSDFHDLGASTGRIFEKGNLLGISRSVRSTTFRGCALLVVDRAHALEWFFDALAIGGFDAGADSRFLSRNALHNRLQLEVSRSRRYENPLSCLVIRIDFGTVEGEIQRRAVHDLIAGSLKEQLRWVDVLGLWSEQALVVILPETAAAAAAQLAQKVGAALLPNLADDAPLVSVNVGASSWRKGDDADRLIRRADIVARRQIGSTARSVSF